MATMSRLWTIFTAITVLAVQLCKGGKSCSIWSSAGPVVQRGSSFQVFCTFNCKCKGSMYSDHPPKLQDHTVLNSTTIYCNVANITKNRTYSCQCKCSPALDPCGLDISAGYLPERPKNFSCIYKVKDNESGVVFFTWKRGRDTFLRDNSVLWVKTVSKNHTDGPVEHKASSKGTAFSSVSFSVSGSVQRISVWVEAKNPLGSAESIPIDYELGDIAMPSTPLLGQPECFSRECVIKVEQPVQTQHLEIQYRAEATTWTSSSPASGVQMGLVQDRSISSLEPYTLYHFRARSKFSTGLWSQWSEKISSLTQEEAPAKELDVWYAKSASDFKSLRVYWKEPNISTARGIILEYKVRVDSQKSGLVFITNVSAAARNYLVPFCSDCEVKVWACNSKGPSPPARITTHHTKVNAQQLAPLKDVKVTADNRSVTISWRKHVAAPLHAAYVVEWYPEGHKLEELRWVRLGRNDNHTVVTGIQPFECYEGAVHVFYNESSVSRTRFTGVSTLTSAPSAGPSVQQTVEGNQVTVTWTEIPRGQRGGCVTKYTIYLEIGSKQQQQHYFIPASERMHIIKDLSPDVYSLWMTASTAEGEGPACQKDKFLIQQETQLSPILVCGVVAPILMVMLCLYHSSAVKQRFWVYFQCLMLDVVPDPANSKWAKECTQEMGKINLQVEVSNSSGTEGEEEPILVDVEELPKPSSDVCRPTDVSSRLLPQTGLSPETEPTTALYPLTTYIKSFSHDSDSSDHTQTSLDTNTTVDYISSHGLGNMDEEDQEDEEEDEDEEEEFGGMLGFFPSHNIFIEPMEFGGKLTLNSVKIDCSDFFLSEQ
ncbi:interleukin-12 receptor subunit beta-2 [Anoplopoma fimbria]|uniref:interleukin-12 receptor subunit beta-2 n=1 Tax=Anoplopoma fimbria TaxID=229290 RepID=UPI0023EB2D9F|nr:interleukin-12 receptor subunit beta-2 [Anoplopoma fimbria]XP_054458661.1 interleukin-12 receptor subunit beta-2 [Anoplopoma fimbria]